MVEKYIYQLSRQLTESCKNKICSSCYLKIEHVYQVSKVWKKIHNFCSTECYHKWLDQFDYKLDHHK